MAKHIPNVTSSYTFSATEEIEAQILTDLQYKFLQTKLSYRVQDMANLIVDIKAPEAFTEFAVQHAYLKAQIDFYTELLAASDYAKTERDEIVNDPLRYKEYVKELRSNSTDINDPTSNSNF